MERSHSFCKKEKSMVFGIDLGTTNSVISYMAQGSTPETITWEDGKFIVPSCVIWKGGDNFEVGDVAYENRYQKNVAYSMKRLMGSSKTKTLVYNGEQRKFKPEEIGAKVLEELKRKVEAKFGKGIVKDVVITVPAYFNDIQRKATKKAGELAGLNVLRLINEPTSASLAYGLDKEQQSSNILVYDLGGGTFDITVFKFINLNEKQNDNVFDIFGINDNEVEKSEFSVEVLGTNGNSALGGDDIDKDMFKIFAHKVNEEIRLKHGVAKAKWEDNISDETREEIILSLERYKKTGGLGTLLKTIDTEFGEMNINFTKEDLERAVDITFERTLTLLKETLAMEKIQGQKIDKVVLVGGSTKSQRIRERLKGEFPEAEFFTGLDPDKSVSLGATVYGSVLDGTSKISILDVNPISIGIKTKNDRFEVAIKQNQILPYQVTRTFTTVMDNAYGINLELFQGKSVFCSNNIKLGDLEITDLPKAKAGELNIYVTLMLDLNGTLTVKVKIKDQEYIKELKNINGNVEIKQEKDKIFAMWERLAKHDSKLKALLDCNADKQEIIKYLQDKRKKTLDTKSIEKEKAKISEVSGIQRFTGDNIE